jgi:CheY-like chemotaxis protein
MNLETCLLVTDDPDDHQVFSEALSEISSGVILVVVPDSEQAIELLKAKKFIPDYIFLDLSMHGVRSNSFFKILKRDDELKRIPIIIYGNDGELQNAGDAHIAAFFNKDYNYSELRNFLREIIKAGKI